MKKRNMFPVVLALFLALVLFASCLNLVFFVIVSHVGENQADDFAAALNYVFQPVSEMLDGHYMTEIDAPMETLLKSAPYVSYSFATKQYPANNELLARLESDLDALVRNSTAVTGALIYSRTTDSYIASTSLTSDNSPLSDGMTGIRNILFNYNTGSIKKNQISTTQHLTFTFQDQGCVVVSKDTTTPSGQVYTTLFLFINIDDFAEYLLSGNTLNAHYNSHVDVGIFDDGGRALYTSASLDPAIASEVLFRTSGNSDVMRLDDGYGVSFRSSVLNWQYVFVVGRSFLSPLSNPISNGSLFLIGLGASAVLSLICILILHRVFRPVDASLRALMDKLGVNDITLFKRPNTFDAISEKVSERLTEAEEVKSVLSSISNEAVSMLFFRMLSGVHVEQHSLKAAMQYTDYGFGIDDVYVAGVAAYTGSRDLSLETRQEVNDFLTENLNKFGSRYDCNHIALTLDMPLFAIVLSFPAGTSIAKCKHMLNELTKQLTNAVKARNLPIELRFGHLYHSIYDLSFSFYEGMKLLEQPQAEQEAEIASLPEAPDTEQPKQDVPPVEDAIEGVDYIGLIDRRAAQIVHLVLEGKRDGVPQVLDRTLDAILADPDSTRQEEHAKRLISAITENMITNRFVVHEHLTDVSGQLAEAIREGLTGEQLMEQTRQGVYTLCEDLDRVMDRQRNPYINAALEYIDAHYSDPNLSLEEIAESLGIAPNYLSSLFSKSLGKKLFEYVNEVRLEKSIEMLLTTRETVNDIGEKSGFGSPRNFMRQFKKYTDMTPTAYRKQHQTRDTEE